MFTYRLVRIKVSTVKRQFSVQTHKRFKRTLFIRTKHNMYIFGVIPSTKLQNDTYTTVKR